jgi:hypothetical protein
MVTCAFCWNKYCTSWGFLNLKIQNAERLSQCILEQLSAVLNGDSNKLITRMYDSAAMSGEEGSVHLFNNYTSRHAN